VSRAVQPRSLSRHTRSHSTHLSTTSDEAFFRRSGDSGFETPHPWVGEEFSRAAVEQLLDRYPRLTALHHRAGLERQGRAPPDPRLRLFLGLTPAPPAPRLWKDEGPPRGRAFLRLFFSCRQLPLISMLPCSTFKPEVLVKNLHVSGGMKSTKSPKKSTGVGEDGSPRSAMNVRRR
jgi:hypothetical protein